MRGEVSAQRAPPLPLCARHSLCQSLACPVHAHIHWIEKWGGPDLRKSSFVLCETCQTLSNTVSVTKPHVGWTSWLLTPALCAEQHQEFPGNQNFHSAKLLIKHFYQALCLSPSAMKAEISFHFSKNAHKQYLYFCSAFVTISVATEFLMSLRQGRSWTLSFSSSHAMLLPSREQGQSPVIIESENDLCWNEP